MADAKPFKECQTHVEKADASVWLQAGNQWAEDALVSRLGAAGAIDAVSLPEI